MPSGARHALAALLACATVLSVTGSASAAPATPFPGASYRVGTKFAGACSEDQATYGYDGLSSQFQSNADSYGHTVGWGRGATGIWMGPGPGPLCADTLLYPGLWRLHMKSEALGDQYGSPFRLVDGGANPCEGKDNEITAVGADTPGLTTNLSGLRGSLLTDGQTITADQNVELQFGDGAILRLEKGASFKVQSCTWTHVPARPEPFKIQFGLFLSAIWAKVPGKVEHVNISTERVVAGNRGTTFWISNIKGVTKVHVDKGSVTLNPLTGKGKWKQVIVAAGHTATQKGSKAPTVRKAPVSSTPPF